MPDLVAIHEPHAVVHAPAGVWGVGTHADPVRVILHDTESHDAAGATDITGILNGWRSAQARLGFLPGAHFIVDEDGNVGKVAGATAILNHCGGLNTGSIGIEQVGFASFDEADWLRRTKQLDTVARILAWAHVQHNIPLEVPASQGHGLPMHGVLTHAMVSRFEPAAEGHTDPGVGYPKGHVIKLARSYVDAGGWPPGKGGAMRRPRRHHKVRVHYTNEKGEAHVTTTRGLVTWLATHRGARQHAGSWEPIHRRKG